MKKIELTEKEIFILVDILAELSGQLDEFDTKGCELIQAAIDWYIKDLDNIRDNLMNLLKKGEENENM